MNDLWVLPKSNSLAALTARNAPGVLREGSESPTHFVSGARSATTLSGSTRTGTGTGRGFGVVGQRQSRTEWITASSLEDRLENRLFDLKVQTASLAMHLSSDWRAGLFRQLDRLLAEENWEPIDDLPNPASYLTAIRLLIFLKDVVRPGLGLSHDGNIVLSWASGKDYLTIECRANDVIRWIVSNTLEDGTRERAAGDSTAKRVPAVIAAYEPAKWLNPR